MYMYTILIQYGVKYRCTCTGFTNLAVPCMHADARLVLNTTMHKGKFKPKSEPKIHHISKIARSQQLGAYQVANIDKDGENCNFHFKVFDNDFYRAVCLATPFDLT